MTSVLDGRALAIAVNTPERIEAHEAATNGQIRTRFPPEPNGYLHIGHAKSMHMNFQGAFEKLGIPSSQRVTYLRYDDTNPEAEKLEYIDSIALDVKYLGWTPDRVTYSSDYFQDLYDFALKLIRDGHAYVCHQTKTEIEACRNVLRAFHGEGTSGKVGLSHTNSESNIQKSHRPFDSYDLHD